jgi:hypothetical protein
VRADGPSAAGLQLTSFAPRSWILKRAPGEGIFAKGEASSSKDASQLQAPPSQGGDDTNASNTTDSAFSTLPTTMASSSALPRGAWATLMTGEKYLPGLAVFAHSLLREHKSAYPLVVMTTGKLSEEARQCVLALGCEIREVKDLRPEVAGTVSFSALTSQHRGSSLPEHGVRALRRRLDQAARL